MTVAYFRHSRKFWGAPMFFGDKFTARTEFETKFGDEN
jgi:hypothetical protein